jgi:integrase
MPSVRVPAGVPRPAPEQVVSAALAAAEHEPRERLMLALAAFAGLRRAEIARVHTRDVTEEGLRVRGKGGTVRVIPIHPVLVELLRDRPPGRHQVENLPTELGWIPRRSHAPSSSARDPDSNNPTPRKAGHTRSAAPVHVVADLMQYVGTFLDGGHL